MTLVLRPPLDNDPRPRCFDMDVLILTVRRHTEIAQWAQRRGYSDDPEYAITALAEAIEHADGVPDKAVRALNVLHRWEDDFLLRNHLASALKHLPECWNFMMLKWVVRTGMRFPAKVGDLVIFFDGEHQRKGRVVKKNVLIASAEIEGENGTHGQVMAEHVLANLTTSRYGGILQVVSNRAPSSAITIPIEVTGNDKPCDSE
jgi:hypothetical protein